MVLKIRPWLIFLEDGIKDVGPEGCIFLYTWKALVGDSLKSCLWPNWLVGDQPQKI